ncbi:hypothetical protein HY339_00870 [Candidatus Gottesmanbacteria bacterium]|nr:hypothetical protein [Candidatus Gottesmanbacteria bacterium]
MTYSYPKRPIKSFQDLEVYQKILGVAVVVAKRLAADRDQRKEKKADSLWGNVAQIARGITDDLLTLPILISSAHSIRFSAPEAATTKLEEAMLLCNTTVVHLEQYRDLGNRTIEAEFFEDQIKTILALRIRILHLAQSWKKFISEGRTYGTNHPTPNR